MTHDLSLTSCRDTVKAGRRVPVAARTLAGDVDVRVVRTAPACLAIRMSLPLDSCNLLVSPGEIFLERKMSQVKAIRALDRGLQTLEVIRGRRSVTLHDLHGATGLSKATLLRILKTLVDRKWVQSRSNSADYVAGPYLASSARFPHRHHVLGSLAIPILDALSQKVVWPSDLGVRQGETMWIIEHSRRNARFVINRKAVGRRPRFLQSAMGRAYLAFCPEDERQDILEKLRQSSHPDDRRANATKWVRAMIEQTREQGYGVREPGYWAGADDLGDDVSSIAVPLMNGKRVIACLNLLWVSDAMPTEKFARKYLATLKEAADRLAKRFAAAHDRSSP